jgi:hypothetical protein
LNRSDISEIQIVRLDRFDADHSHIDGDLLESMRFPSLLQRVRIREYWAWVVELVESPGLKPSESSGAMVAGGAADIAPDADGHPLQDAFMPLPWRRCSAT